MKSKSYILKIILCLLAHLTIGTLCYAQSYKIPLSVSEKAFLLDFVTKKGYLELDSKLRPVYVENCFFIPFLVKGSMKGREVGVYAFVLPQDPEKEWVCLVDSTLEVLGTKYMERDMPIIIAFLRRHNLKFSSEEFCKFLEAISYPYQENNPPPNSLPQK